MKDLRFPKNFIFGAATAAYQIEGGRGEDGKGDSIWDKFCEIPGKIDRNENGNIACDHYHRMREDVARMKEMHLEGYRFSVAWTRILPDGVGKVNPAGIAFYDSLINELLAAGIKPLLTLYHWDLPQALQDRGGWLNAESVDWFTAYAETVFAAFGDRVKDFITFNEPFVFTDFGYVTGSFPPGIKGDYRSKLLAGHHVLMAHGAAVRAFRKLVPDGRIGITLDYAYNVPATDKKEDIEAAARTNEFWAGWYFEPVVLGHYPVTARKWFEAHGMFPAIGANDEKLIAEPTDFLGINHYFCNYVTADPANERDGAKTVDPKVHCNDMGWPITEDGFYKMLKYFQSVLKVPLIITENGISLNDIVSVDGTVEDYDRIDYMKRYLGARSRAIREGLDCRGYYYWSFMDNMEWAAGYKPRFGLVYVDYATQKRILKKSASWYRELIDEKNK
ncbi:MAG: beta-glucosidase [Clostridiales bacterium]|nr:beta-glucosidase [Clostridiales bacterium]